MTTTRAARDLLNANVVALNARLDRDPYDDAARLEVAQTLTTLGHPLAPGYQALARFEVVPTNYGSSDWPKCDWVYLDAEKAAARIEDFSYNLQTGPPDRLHRCTLPHPWAEAVYCQTTGLGPSYQNWGSGWCCYQKTRKAAEEMAARAWLDLSEADREALWVVHNMRKAV